MYRRLLILTVAAMFLVVAFESGVSGAAARRQTPRVPGFGTPARDQNLVTMRVFADTNQPSAGKTFHLIFVFEIEKKWHLYWKNPGAGAAPIDVAVTAPDGFTVKPAIFPRPEIIKSPTGDIYGYNRQAALFVPITPPADWSNDAAALQYEISYAVCDDQRCVLERKDGMYSLFQGADAPDSEVVRTLAARLPRQAADADDVAVELAESKLTVTGPAKGHTNAAFLPNPTPGVIIEDPEITVTDDRFRLTATISTQPGNFAGTKPRAAGLIALGEQGDDPSYEFSIAVDH
jgi:DsbC/DsbD-like thiol-disulfide interchange protein